MGDFNVTFEENRGTLLESIIKSAMADYFREHPNGEISSEAIAAAVNAYLAAHPIEGGIDTEEVNALIADYLTEHPIEGVSTEDVQQMVNTAVNALDLSGLKGDTGATPNITATASVNNTSGTPSVEVSKSGTAENPVFAFSFSGLKGEKGADGSGESSADGDSSGVGRNDLFIIAHRGRKTNTIPDNTIAAFINAVEEGFHWLEIDVRPTVDNVLVLTHDNKITAYQNGVSKSVTVNGTTYADLKTYTWDRNGNYPIDTFSKALYALKRYGVSIIVDLKVFTLIMEAIREVCDLGMSERCIVSCDLDNALQHIDELNKVPQVGLRMQPYNYSKLVRVIDALDNPIYLDMHTSIGNLWKTYLPNALAVHKPIIVAGFTTTVEDGRKGTINIANGVMSDNNESYQDVINATNIEIGYSDITLPNTAIHVKDTPLTITASNDAENGGYINLYTENPTICSLTQDNMGDSVTATLTPQAEGSTILRALNGSNTASMIVNVSNSDIIALVGDANDNTMEWDSGYGAKLTLFSFSGDHNINKNLEYDDRFRLSRLGFCGDKFYNVEIPEGAISLTASIDTDIAPNGQVYLKVWTAEGVRRTYKPWGATQTIEFEEGDKYVGVSARNNGNANMVTGGLANDTFALILSALSYSFNYAEEEPSAQ